MDSMDCDAQRSDASQRSDCAAQRPNTAAQRADYTSQSCGGAVLTPCQRYLASPIAIRGKEIQNRLLLAPMAGLGNVAFRELVAEFGGFGLLFTGMCSAKAVPQENRYISKVFKWRDEELPFLVCQLLGGDPDSMALAAERVQREGFFGVDLNFGCCAAAICKKGGGASILKDPALAKRIVAAVRERVSIPLFVKFRTGWERDPLRASKEAAQMAASFEAAGADALIFHPRMAPDRRLRPPKWEDIRLVKEAVSIPVFGNGNIFETSDCEKMVNISSCDGISIGRMAVARPWIFATITHGFSPESSSSIYRYTAMRIMRLLLKYHDERTAVKMFKKFVPYYSAGFKFGHSISKQLLKTDSSDEILRAVDAVFATSPEITVRPNLHLSL